jgi:ADP-dependent NAD(P)H-hydrate dehydratase / NAD(P)H-hydrate epimerase
MRVLTASQMRLVESATIEQGMPGIKLMRNAGDAVHHAASRMLDEEGRVAIFAGKGNNGGDGFRVAELFARSGIQVDVYLLSDADSIRGDAKTCLSAYLSTKQPLYEITTSEQLRKHADNISDASLIVDAIYGTGLTGEVTGIAAEAISLMNWSRKQIIAIDIPSGVDASTGEVAGIAVTAMETVTFGCLKVGHVVKPGALYCGHITVENIGFSDTVMETVEPYARALVQTEAAALLPVRPYDAYKGSVGKVFVLAGSVGMTGAATLSSSAVLRVGAGVSILGCPESLNDILEMKLTEVMTRPLPEVRKKRCLSLRALGMVRELAAGVDVTAVGPGLGRYHETMELIRRFVRGYRGRMIIDADGLIAFSGDTAKLRESKAEIILTPHYGELARLMGTEPSTIADDPRTAALEAARATGAVVLLKGSPTVIANPSSIVYLNGTGNEGMATAGTGDVLTGTIAGFAAQGLHLFEAAVLGAFVHGMAGDIAAEETTAPGMIAGDILYHLPSALSDLLSTV